MFSGHTISFWRNGRVHQTACCQRITSPNGPINKWHFTKLLHLWRLDGNHACRWSYSRKGIQHNAVRCMAICLLTSFIPAVHKMRATLKFIWEVRPNTNKSSNFLTLWRFRDIKMETCAAVAITTGLLAVQGMAIFKVTGYWFATVWPYLSREEWRFKHHSSQKIALSLSSKSISSAYNHRLKAIPLLD